MWVIDDGEKNMMKAKMDHSHERGWGLNEAAIVVLNTMLAGARDGWFFCVKQDGLDEAGKKNMTQNCAHQICASC